MVRVMLVLALTSCGRIGFDLIGGDGGGAGDDGTAITDGDGTVDGPAITLVAGGEDCASAPTITFGTSGTGSFTGAVDDFDTMGCSDGADVVYRVSGMSTNGHPVRITPTFAGSITVGNSCPPVGELCGDFTAMTTFNKTWTFMPGANYIIIDKMSGGGTTFDFTVF